MSAFGKRRDFLERGRLDANLRRDCVASTSERYAPFPARRFMMMA